ncbi:MAG: hypothetical protein ACR2L1_07885 [Pyrinomonadaceae bacterium]
MLKILLAFLIAVEILIFLLMLYCLTGINVLLPGLGLIISGGLIAVVLLVVQVILVLISLLLYRRIRRDSGNMA